MLNFILYAPGVSLSLCCMLSVVACMSKKTGVPRTESDVIVHAKNIAMQYTERGLLKVKLRGPIQKEFENGDLLFPKGIFIDHFDKEANLAAKLRADTGFFFEESGLYEARGNVYLENLEKGSFLETKKLTWNPEIERIYTDQFVRIYSEEEFHTGEGLNASEDFEDYHILKPSGTIEVENTMP